MADPRPDPDRAHGVPPAIVSDTSTLANRTGSWKEIRPVFMDRLAPCNAGCPVGIDIEGYMDLLRQAKVHEAVELLLSRNPLPATTGRVCYHPCEEGCNRGRYDAAISIHAVERMLGDFALAAPLPFPIAPAYPEQIAIVGSGPAGLSCAWHLIRQGYRVTVFDADAKPGGMLRAGIPPYRLPREVLDREIERIRALGVDFRCGVRLGVDLPWDGLDPFDAVFLATGAHMSRAAGFTGEDLPGVRAGLSFLHEVNAGGRPAVGARVVVVGGGNTAIDCARAALRLGAEAVVLYRRSREEMPAFGEEVAEAEQEGVRFEFLAAPLAAHAPQGRLAGLSCARMRLGEPDASGRRRPVAIPGEEFFVPADTVLLAVGESADIAGLPPGVHTGPSDVRVDETGAANRHGVYAGGDLVDQPRTVAHAIGSGRRVADAIHRHLRDAAGDAVPPPEPPREPVGFDRINTAYFPRAARHADRLAGPAERLEGFVEVNHGLPPLAALDEASRCFNCGVCNECEVCRIFCPDVAVTKRAGGRGFVVAYDYCKGCGLCSAECPRGAVTMTREGA